MIRILDLSAVLFIIFVFAFLFVANKTNEKLFFLIFVIYSIFLSLRTIGDDTAEYISIYTAVVPQFSWDMLQVVNGFRIEVLWFNFITILKTIGMNKHYVFFFLSAFLPSLAIIWVYRKTCLFSVSVSAFFYCLFLLILYQYEINGVRAFAASCFVFLALWFFYDKKNLKCLMTAIFAIMLHTSAFIILPFIFIFKIKFNVRALFFLFSFFLIIIIVASQLDWDEPFLAYIYFKLDYYLFSIEHDMLNGNGGRELYVIFVRGLFVASALYSFILLLLGADSYKQNAFIEGLYKCAMFTTIGCMLMMIFGVYMFAYRILMFVQINLIFITLHSMLYKPKKYKLPLFIVVTGFFWTFFIIYASRFYDS
ncbi:EpsG family protein [Pectobacterium quasiaquaticum]|uniref:EpsG family protein n=1 Tax=Pectobacterium quasiaquaticum TaxID=2774015 RepID=A0A9Q2ICD1_9GAMM|nr:EpsG family protein [Pectobacterium quasiaquaticum]MBN3063857.1 EpsG family protein [Pectobacterium aquaticum]URG47836.1 EpsG family protein [Pectobacterium quasiaquaticum]